MKWEETLHFWKACKITSDYQLLTVLACSRWFVSGRVVIWVIWVITIHRKLVTDNLTVQVQVSSIKYSQAHSHTSLLLLLLLSGFVLLSMIYGPFTISWKHREGKPKVMNLAKYPHPTWNDNFERWHFQNIFQCSPVNCFGKANVFEWKMSKQKKPLKLQHKYSEN